MNAQPKKERWTQQVAGRRLRASALPDGTTLLIVYVFDPRTARDMVDAWGGSQEDYDITDHYGYLDTYEVRRNHICREGKRLVVTGYGKNRATNFVSLHEGNNSLSYHNDYDVKLMTRSHELGRPVIQCWSLKDGDRGAFVSSPAES